MTEELYYQAMDIKCNLIELNNLETILTEDTFSISYANNSVLIEGVVADEIRDKIKPIVTKYRKKLQKEFDAL